MNTEQEEELLSELWKIRQLLETISATTRATFRKVRNNRMSLAHNILDLVGLTSRISFGKRSKEFYYNNFLGTFLNF